MTGTPAADPADSAEGHEDWLTGWSHTHDYDPTWDYAVRFDQRDDPLLAQAQRAADKLSDLSGGTLSRGRVYPADLDGPAAVFVSGTSHEPVVVIDLDCHRRAAAELTAGDDHALLEAQRMVAATIVHEMRHAAQEALELPADEDDAEHGASHLPF